jgi:cell division protein FtsZ
MQYGNLKMKEAFAKADNVLATAAKCITDIINSKGHIIVDFADVCTVMKSGGVAILGSAMAEGEDRAQKAIEEALNSPLLNDSDIRGAKWLLLNINSPEGDQECTMDELEVINTYLRMQAGEATDVIMGMGYDNTLGDRISITLIATGFEHKDPFAEKFNSPAAKPEPKAEKIVMTLGVDGEEKKMYQQQILELEDKDPFAPRISEGSLSMPVATEELPPSWIDDRQSLELMELHYPENEVPLPVPGQPPLPADEPIIHFELTPEITGPVQPVEQPALNVVPEALNFKLTEQPENYEQRSSNNDRSNFLAKPSNIYAQIPDQKPAAINYEQAEPVSTPPLETTPVPKPVEEEPEFEMKLVERDEHPETADKARLQTQKDQPSSMSAEDPAPLDDAEDQKRRAAERIQKLRNLSFNMNAADPNNEFDSVPAYVRRNMELFGNTLTSVENFYSKYTVNKDENTNETNISSINTFLDGKKPD